MTTGRIAMIGLEGEDWIILDAALPDRIQRSAQTVVDREVSP
jgi:hypothetical protein